MQSSEDHSHACLPWVGYRSGCFPGLFTLAFQFRGLCKQATPRDRIHGDHDCYAQFLEIPLAK